MTDQPDCRLRLIEHALVTDRRRAERLLDSIAEAVISTDVSGRVTYVNPVAERMTGWRLEEAAGRPFEQVFRIVDRATHEASQNPMSLAVRLNAAIGANATCVLIRRDGFESVIEESAAPIHDQHGHVTGAVMVFHDVSAARARALQVSHLAAHDGLTDLPNRMLLHERLSQALASAERHRYLLAVAFLDLDGFKQINDTLGHGVGDRLLQAVALRLVESVRHSDTVSRQGGDEFVLLLSRVEQHEDAAATARKIVAGVAVPFDVDGHRIHVTASVGVSIYPQDGTDGEMLIRNADRAMYRAKKRGHNGFQFYRPEMHTGATAIQSGTHPM